MNVLLVLILCLAEAPLPLHGFPCCAASWLSRKGLGVLRSFVERIWKSDIRSANNHLNSLGDKASAKSRGHNTKADKGLDGLGARTYAAIEN